MTLTIKEQIIEVYEKNGLLPKLKPDYSYKLKDNGGVTVHHNDGVIGSVLFLTQQDVMDETIYTEESEYFYCLETKTKTKTVKEKQIIWPKKECK